MSLLLTSEIALYNVKVAIVGITMGFLYAAEILHFSFFFVEFYTLHQSNSIAL